MSMLLITVLAVVEVFANIWLYNVYSCEFETNEIFKNTDAKANRKLCLESLGYEVWALGDGKQDFKNENITIVEGTTWSHLDNSLIYLNKYEFRGPEITKEKPENTYRIFAIGASTTFGAGVFDTQTYPFYLQLLYDEIDLDFDIEVINAGWPGKWSVIESNNIKKKYIGFDPDLYIVYNGAGEVYRSMREDDPMVTPTHWKERWIDICELGKKYDFETIITLQPLVGQGNKSLTTQEENAYKRIDRKGGFDNYPEYADQLKEINNHCSLTADLRGLFDNFKEPIFYDYMHTGYRGNQIIAEKMFQLSLPIILEDLKNIDEKVDNQKTSSLDSDSPLVSSGEDLDYEYLKELRNIISFYKTPKVIKLIF